MGGSGPTCPEALPSQPGDQCQVEGPSREGLCQVPPPHMATLCFWDLIRPEIWRGHSGNLAASKVAGPALLSQSCREGGETEASAPHSVWGMLLLCPPHLFSPEPQARQPCEYHRNFTLPVLSSLSPRLQRERLEECPLVRFRNRFIKMVGYREERRKSPTLNALSPGLNPIYWLDSRPRGLTVSLPLLGCGQWERGHCCGRRTLWSIWPMPCHMTWNKSFRLLGPLIPHL